MKLHSLFVSGFRAFSGSTQFNLNADVVVVSGPNGTGKTSIFDAILWALTGQLPRFEDMEHGVVSLYSKSGQASVKLVLLDNKGKELEVSRLHDGTRDSVNFRVDGQEFVGSSAQVELLRRLWPTATSTDDAMGTFATALTRGVYLQQDLVREFLERDSAESRYKVIAELVGAGRLNEFMEELERASRSWSRARSEPERKATELHETLSDLTARFERLTDSVDDLADLTELWNTWWISTLNFGVSMEAPSIGAMERGALLEQALGSLRAERQASERRRAAASALLRDIELAPKASDEERAARQRLHQEIADLQSEMDALQRELARLQAEAARERAKMTKRRTQVEEFQTLASLALRYLEGPCPVCGQDHDVSATRERLESILLPRALDEPLPAAEAAAQVAGRIAEIEGKLAENRAEHSRLQEKIRAAEIWSRELEQRVAEFDLDVETTGPRDAIERVVEFEGQRIEALEVHYEQGETLSLSIARASELAQRSELERQIAQVERAVEVASAELSAHERTGALAKGILAELREASEEVVGYEVKRLEPAVARIYARMDPHPAFKTVELLTSFVRGRGRIKTVVADVERNVIERDPLPVFSSSQLNALAVSVFLGLNLGISNPPLSAILLDDPLQSLDDVNLLGLIDTLRRTKALRQLIVSTHDRRFADLLERKLRPVGDEESTLTIKMEDWNRDGPSILQSELPRSVETSQVA